MLRESPFSVEWSGIPAEGKGQLFVSANDGIRSGETLVQAFVLEPRPASLYILSPRTSACLPYGQPVSVIGACLDASGSPCSPEPIIWLLNGTRVAAGTAITAIEQPAPGAHVLTLVYEWKDRRVEAAATFQVEEIDNRHREWLAAMQNTL